MIKTPNKRLIGIFGIISIFLFIILTSMLLANKIFVKNDNLIVMYFEESIKGLNIGSPVLFRGVEIGKVSKIDLVADTEGLNFTIPVFVQLNNNQIIKIQDHKRMGNGKKFLTELINKGLRARLVTQSYLTGHSIIELEIVQNLDKPNEIKKYNKKNNIIEIPTIISPITELSKNFRDLPMKEVIDNFNILLLELNKNIPQILNQTIQLTNNLNKLIKNNSDKIPYSIGNINRAVNDISNTAKALQNFVDYLERHPDALLKGKNGY